MDVSFRPARYAVVPVLGAVVLLASACADLTPPADTPPSAEARLNGTPAAPALTINGVSGTIVPGVTLSLTATLKDPRAPLPNPSLVWRSSDEAVATVSAEGSVRAISPGTTTITARLGAARGAPNGAGGSVIAGSVAVTVAEGGVVSPAGGSVSAYAGAVTLALPAGALQSTTPITVDVVPDAPRTSNTVGPVYEFGPDGTQFAEPVDITLTYDPAALPANAEESALRVARYENGAWVLLTERVSVDPDTRTVRAATRHFSKYGLITDPCAPQNGAPATINGNIETSDCVFDTGTVKRFTDNYRFTPTANVVTVLKSTSGFSGVFGIKEYTADARTGLVFGSTTLPNELRVIGNGDMMQIFASGDDLTQLGAYSLTKSAAVGHACPFNYPGKPASPTLFIVPGASYADAVLSTNSCADVAAYSPFPEVNGKPLLLHYLRTKLDAGKRYTISASGMPGQSALTIFRGGVVAQNVSAPVSGVRTVTVTPATAGYYWIELSSGGFEFANRTGAWLNPVINYTVTVSRGVLVTP